MNRNMKVLGDLATSYEFSSGSGFLIKSSSLSPDAEFAGGMCIHGEANERPTHILTLCLMAQGPVLTAS